MGFGWRQSKKRKFPQPDLFKADFVRAYQTTCASTEYHPLPRRKLGWPHARVCRASGALFENAYCTHPICCPSRANMWSGRYTHQCESWNNYKGLEPGMWSLLGELPKTLVVGNFGKLDYLSGGHSQSARLGAWLGTSGINKPIFDKDKSQCFSVEPSDEIRCHQRDWGYVDGAVDFLKQHREEPFFLCISPGLAHAPFRTNRHWLDRIPDEAVDIPAIDSTDHPVRLYQRMTKAWRYGLDESVVRQVRRIYFAMCAEADALVGRVYDAVRALGLAENTYFVFASDHGELALNHQEWYKMSFYEGSVRVPLILTGPGVERGLRLSNLVSLIDICPTFREMAGLPQPETLDGESLLPLVTGDTTESRDSAYACFTGITLNTSGYMLRKGEWKYVAYVGYPAQLFNIENDPGELHDMCADRPEIVVRMDSNLRSIVDYEQTHRDLLAYNKEAFRQWRRQALRGLHVDGRYGLENNPSTDYWRIMDNCFTGYNEDDEELVNQWLEA